jgi:hypothetical protein
MPPCPPPKLWNVLAYVALISVGFGYVVFVSGPHPYDRVWAWVIWLVMINVANVALNWQAWSQPMRLPTRTELRSLKPLRFIEILNALVVISWVGVGVSFLYGLPEEARDLDVLVSNRPMWMFFWAALVIVQVRAFVMRSSSAGKAEQSLAAESR